MSELRSTSGKTHKKSDHLETHGNPLRRHGHLLQRHGEHLKTHGNRQKNTNQNCRMLLTIKTKKSW